MSIHLLNSSSPRNVLRSSNIFARIRTYSVSQPNFFTRQIASLRAPPKSQPLLSSTKPTTRPPAHISLSHRSYSVPATPDLSAVVNMEEPLNRRTAPLAERITDNMERPALDDRSYRVIKLPNQLEALLIHDPETDKASGALDVNVGSFSDSDDMPGLAHAVEHMLFMGTKKVRSFQAHKPSFANLYVRSIRKRMPTIST